MDMKQIREAPDVAAICEAGLSGYGQEAIYLTPDGLLALSELCLSRGRIVHTIEAYEVTADADHPATEFSLCGQDESEAARSWPDRMRDSHSIVSDIVNAARASPSTIKFQVWLDWE